LTWTPSVAGNALPLIVKKFGSTPSCGIDKKVQPSSTVHSCN